MEDARELLASLPARVCDAGGHRDSHPDGYADDQPLSGFHWSNESVDRTLADEARIQVLAALTKLAKR